MAVGFSNTNKPINPRGLDASPKGYNRAALYSGKALDFDGVNDSIDISNFSLNGYTAFSICFYKTDDFNNAMIFSSADGLSDGINIYQVSPGYFRARLNGSNTDTDLEVSTKDGFFVLTYDGTNLNWYYEAQNIGSGTTSQTFAITNTTSTIGRQSYAATQYLNGQIAGFKIFNTALTAAQVSDLYNNPEKIVPTGVEDTALKLWLPMMEGAGTTAYDGSGNGNHGTINGATYVNGVGSPVAQSAVIDWNKSHNYIDKSEEFETAFWTENRLVPITNDSFIAPDGSATATEIVENTANDSHFLAQTLSVTAGDYFISIFAKKRDYDWFQISTGGDISRYSNFNLTTGALGNSDGFTDRFIENYGNGWYRVGGKITTSATSFNFFPTLIQSDVASRFDTYAGTDKGTYIWGAQATKSATLKPYLRNIGTAAITDDVLLPQGLTSGRDITGVNLFENVRKQGALNLDGKSWAEVHDNASLDFGTGSFTLEAWAKVAHENTGSSVNAILGLGGNTTTAGTAYIETNAVPAIVFRYNTNFSVSSSLTIGDWVHIVATYDETNMKVYVNGVLEDTDAATAGNMTNTEIKTIGRDNNLARTYKDQIAQPRIYNRALSPEEIERNYHAGKRIYK